MSIRLHSRNVSRIEWNVCLCGSAKMDAVLEFLQKHSAELGFWTDEAEYHAEIQNPENLPRLVHAETFPDNLSRGEIDEVKAFLLGCYENSKRTGGVAYLDAF